MEELAKLVAWFFGPLVVVSILVLGLSAFGPILGIGCLCLIAYAFLAGAV